jgi:hypothetical protein
MFDCIDMDEMHDPNITSKKFKKQKDPIIEVIPDPEEEAEVKVGAPGPIYNDTTCCTDTDIV